MCIVPRDSAEDERAHRLVLRAVREKVVILDRQNVREVLVTSSVKEVDLDGGVNSKDTGPYEDENWAEVLASGLKKLGDVREDTDGQDEMDCPWAKIDELG